MAKFGKLDMLDGQDAFKVLLYSLASAIVTGIIAWLSQVNIPSEWLAFVPIVNVILVSIKNLLENR